MFVCWLKCIHLIIVTMTVQWSYTEVSALNIEPRGPWFSGLSDSWVAVGCGLKHFRRSWSSQYQGI